MCHSDYLQIKTIVPVPDTYGSYIKITKIGLYDKNGKWKRWVKLNDKLIEKLSEQKIQLEKE